MAEQRAAKEWVLNITFNRWQFNRPKYVGKLVTERGGTKRILNHEIIGAIQSELEQLQGEAKRR